MIIRNIFFLLLACSSLLAQESKSEFSLLYLPTFPLQNSTEYRDIGPQWFGGGFIFGGGKVTKGLLTYNFISSAGGPFTNIREFSANTNINPVDYGAMGHIVSLGFVFDMPEGISFILSPSVTLGAKGLVLDRSGDIYKVDTPYEFPELLGFKAGLGIKVQLVRFLVLYEYRTRSISTGLALRF